MKKIIILAVTILVSMISTGQENKMKKINKQYRNMAYIDAQKQYLQIAEKGYESIDLFQKLGDTYYFNNDYKNAHRWYSKLFEYDPYDIKPEYYLRYAQSLKSVSEYEKADQIMNTYTKVHGDKNIIKDYVSNPNYLKDIETQSGRYSIKNLSMNSGAQDFGTSYLNGGDKIVFASSRDTTSFVRRRHKWNNREFLNLYQAKVDAQTGELDSLVPFDNKINTKYHESNAVFTHDGTTVYFTRNNYHRRNYGTSSENINKLKIFRATRENKNSEWTNVVELPFNSDEYSSAHPSLNFSEDKLYFASDRPGSVEDISGNPTSDIWYVDILEDGDYGNPINVVAVNTSGNELFPFVSKKGDLYFSSTGHPGLGGLDVFVIKLDESSSGPINIGRPVNGPQDDFAYIINDDTMTGYFSSNRDSGKGLDDIYSFEQIEPIVVCNTILKGVVTDVDSGELVAGALVVVYDSDNKEVTRKVVESDAAYNFDLECSSRYSIRATKQDYTQAEKFVETPLESASLEVSLEIAKVEPEQLSPQAIEGEDIAKLPWLDIQPIYFDLDKDNINARAEIEIQKVLFYMKNYPTSVIDIRSHTDSRASHAYNEDLSDRRAKSTRAYLIKNGISPSRLTAKGYGETQLVNECADGVRCTEEQHSLNRRSEFIVIRR